MAEKLLKRSEVSVNDTWRLEDIYASNEAWEKEFENLKRMPEQILSYKGRLSNPTDALKALDLSTNARRIASSLYTYARMRRDQDNSEALYQGMVARISQSEAEISGACAFISPELLSLGDEYLKTLGLDERFKDYDMFFDDLIRTKAHTLSDSEERLLKLSGDMASTASTVYDMLTDADMRFPEITNDEGEKQRLTQSNYIPFLMSRNVSTRKSAFEALYTTFKGFSATIPALYSGNVKTELFYAKARGFASSIEASLYNDNIPLSVYDSLIEAINSRLGSLQRFVNINMRLNGINEPHFYDLYLSPEMGFDIKLEFKDAYKLVMDCLKPMGEDYINVMQRALDERWIDPYENEGKSGGAYSWGTYDSHPYVLCNYKNDLDHLLTVAHEMGHSLHTYYSDSAQPYIKSGYSLFVAEVASTVNECLVLYELMDRYHSDEAQAYLIYNLLDSFRGTVFRQTMFAEFEKNAHAMAQAGEALTCESLSNMYAELNKKYYANLTFDELISLEWMRIPHFYNSFYVYKYATGFTSAMAIAKSIRERGDEAVNEYKRFLKAGCSLYPLNALKLAGVDLTTPAPVLSALDAFDQLLDKYDEVTKRIKA